MPAKTFTKNAFSISRSRIEEPMHLKKHKKEFKFGQKKEQRHLHEEYEAFEKPPTSRRNKRLGTMERLSHKS